MHLIDVEYLLGPCRDPKKALEQFNDETTLPPYAILSHGWSTTHEEITFEDFQNESIDSLEKRAGWRKIHDACWTVAGLRDGLASIRYLWIDTCCIDKRSSAELTESINSMFRWYQNSAVCLAYIHDYAHTSVSYTSSSNMEFGALPSCYWFTRGWTLQELVAPSRMYFLNSSWELLGTRQELADILSDITGVDREVLDATEAVSFTEYSVAKRMSWAANRQTTKPEDRAYSLIGIFDVNLLPIYGEGMGKAMWRLQNEIIKTSSDMSIFAWELPIDTGPGDYALLSPSPDYFSSSKDVSRTWANEHFAATNKGIQFCDIVLLLEGETEDDGEAMLLNVGDERRPRVRRCIRLRKVAKGMFTRYDGQLHNLPASRMYSSTHAARFYVAFAPQDCAYLDDKDEARAIKRPLNLRIRDLAPQSAWDYDNRRFLNHKRLGGSNDWRALDVFTTPFKVRVGILVDLRKPTPYALLFNPEREDPIARYVFNRKHKIETDRWYDLEKDVPLVRNITNKIQRIAGEATYCLSAAVVPLADSSDSMFTLQLSYHACPSGKCRGRCPNDLEIPNR